MSNFLNQDISVIVAEAEKKAKILVKDDGLTTNQLRNFYSAITRMRIDFEQSDQNYEKIKNQLIMLKPKLAYAAGRQSAVKKHFYPFMKERIEEVENTQEEAKKKIFENFFLLVESLVAYHKFYGEQ